MPNKRGWLLLIVLAGLAVVGALVQTYRLEQVTAGIHRAEQAATHEIGVIESAVGDVRLAQAGYVAAGQGPDFWMGKFDDLTAQIDATLERRQNATVASAAQPRYAAARGLLNDLRASDARARNYVENGQRLLASDVVFVESLQILGHLSNELASARNAEVVASGQAFAATARLRVALNAGALAFGLLLAVVLFRRADASAAQLQAALAAPPQTVAAVADRPSPAAGNTRPSDPARIAEAADVCVDIARLLDGRDLPGLLGRAAAAIGATGLVLWVVDAGKENLRASMAHGYSDKVLQRLGVLSVEADNVTAMAFRTLRPQIVRGAGADAAGAIAVPLITTTGCIGVLAAEIPGAASGGDHLPVARVIAAQLSAVIGPGASVASDRAALG